MRRIGRSFAGGLLALMACLLLAPSAPAQEQPPTLPSVTIAGDPVVGSTLTAVINAPVVPSRITYRWCGAGEPGSSCTRKGPGSTYTLTEADLGRSLFVKADVEIGAFKLELVSGPTAPVVPAPPPPDPTVPTPVPLPDPLPDPLPPPDDAAPAPTFASVGGNEAPPSVIATSEIRAPAPLRFMSPFPVVRVRGSLAARGARIAILKVTASWNATVEVRCSGPSCPFERRWVRTGRVRALERYLAAGTRITVRVRRLAYIGKYARITIRAGGPPSRRDACLLPGSGRPVTCGPA